MATAMASPYYGSVFGQCGRIMRVGQLWRHNDPRRLRVVKIVALHHATQVAHVENVTTQKRSTIPFVDFTIGREGWSLEREVIR